MVGGQCGTSPSSSFSTVPFCYYIFLLHTFISEDRFEPVGLHYGVPRRASRKYHGHKGVADVRGGCGELFVTRCGGGERGH